MTDLSPAQINFIKESRKKRQRQLRQTQLGILLAFGIAILVILIVWREQQKTQFALNDLLAAQAAREKTELRVLLQQAGQIAKGENCPPKEMRQTIDSLHKKHQQELSLQELYRHTIEHLQHCE
jgi:type II secretory pathway pseudopilin PulG